MIEQSIRFAYEIKFYIKQEIKAFDKLEPSIRQVVCLDNQKCLVLYGDRCCVIDLEGPTKGNRVQINLESKGTHIFPLDNGFCVKTDTTFQLFDYSYNKHIIPIPQSLKQHTNRKTLNNFVNRLNHSISISIHLNQQPFPFVDQNEWVCTKLEVGSIQIMSMITKKRKTLILPFNEKVNSFYLVDNNQGICIIRIGGFCRLWMVEFSKDGKFKELQNIPADQPFIRFDRCNIDKKIILFSNYKNAFIYNYQKQFIIATLQLLICDVSKKISQDFKHYLGINKKQSDIKIQHLRAAPPRRKIMMSIFLKSKLYQLYGGDGLIRRILSKVQD